MKSTILYTFSPVEISAGAKMERTKKKLLLRRQPAAAQNFVRGFKSQWDFLHFI
jgi:hypothetical protein